MGFALRWIAHCVRSYNGMKDTTTYEKPAGWRVFRRSVAAFEAYQCGDIVIPVALRHEFAEVGE